MSASKTFRSQFAKPRKWKWIDLEHLSDVIARKQNLAVVSEKQNVAFALKQTKSLPPNDCAKLNQLDPVHRALLVRNPDGELELYDVNDAKHKPTGFEFLPASVAHVLKQRKVALHDDPQIANHNDPAFSGACVLLTDAIELLFRKLPYTEFKHLLLTLTAPQLLKKYSQL